MCKFVAGCQCSHRRSMQCQRPCVAIFLHACTRLYTPLTRLPLRLTTATPLTRLYTPLTRPLLRLTTATPLTRLLLWRAGLSGDVSVRVDDMGSPMRRNFRAKTAVGGVCGRVGGAPALERHALLSQQICLPRRRLSRIR